jgi:hypothetical protein
MAPSPAAKFIPEFGGEQRVKTSPHAWPTAPAPAASEAAPPQFATAAAKAASRVEDAYERGYAAGKAAALEAFEARLEEERACTAQQLAIERYTWSERESEKLADKIGEGLREISTHLGDLMARILRPFLGDAAYRQAIAELFVALEAMIGKEEGITLEIFGPEDLLQPLRAKLGTKNIAAVFTPTETVDVRVIAGQTILETCIGTWMRKIEERLQ